MDVVELPEVGAKPIEEQRVTVARVIVVEVEQPVLLVVDFEQLTASVEVRVLQVLGKPTLVSMRTVA